MIRPRWETPDPKGVKGSYGPQVTAWALRELGLKLDEWQKYVLHQALRYDRNGDVIARRSLWSTARQNGKSVIVRSFFDWLLDPEAGGKVEAFKGWEYATCAAHDSKQARTIYRGVYKDLKQVKRLTGKEVRTDRQKAERPPIYLTLQAGIQSDTLTFDISTSEADASRSNSYGAIAWDELLTQKTWDMYNSLRPTQTMQRSSVMFLTSTAGFDDSVVLRDLYDRLRRQATGDEAPDPTFYGAWWESEDPDAGFVWPQIRQANPSPRLPRDVVRSEYRDFPPDGWKRERLNHFIDVTAAGAFNPGVWAACRYPDPLDGVDGPYALGIDIQPGWERATIVASAIRADGRVACEVYRDIRENVTADRLIAEVHAFPEPVVAVAYDGASGAAAAFRRDAAESGHPWDELKPSAVVAACMDVTEMIQSGRLAVGDPLIDAQIATAARRNVGQDGAFRFSRRESLGPIDAVLAMTFAAHAIAYGAQTPSLYVPTAGGIVTA